MIRHLSGVPLFHQIQLNLFSMTVWILHMHAPDKNRTSAVTIYVFFVCFAAMIGILAAADAVVMPDRPSCPISRPIRSRGPSVTARIGRIQYSAALSTAANVSIQTTFLN